MRLLIKKSIAMMTLTLFLVSPGASAATLEGQVVSLASQGPGLWKVVVKGAGGEQSFMVSTKTAVQKEVPVEMLKAGDRLVSKNAGKGTKGFKAPFGNMSASAKKALGLPNIPSVPEVPKVPPIPSKQQMQGSPSSAKGNPQASAGPGSAGGGAAPAGMPGLGGGAGGMAPGKPPAKEEPKVKTQDEILQEKGFQNEKLLFPPKEGAGKPGEEVTQVNKTDRGFEVTVVSETGKPEKQMYAPGKKVLKIFSLKEIKKDDKVLVNFNETDKTVTELQVKS